MDTPSAARAALAALAASPLADAVALKGGLALAHVYGSPRATDDLDLGGLRAHGTVVTDAATAGLQAVLDAIADGLAEAGLADAHVEVVEWSTRLPSVHAAVRWPGGSLGLDVSACEPVAAVPARALGVPVLAQSIDDVVADKLKTLLQQHRRHTVRPSDVYDLWHALARSPLRPTPAATARALSAKLAVWPGLSADGLGDPGVVAFAEQGYRALRAEQPDLAFAPFDVVWAAVEAFVAAMR